MLRAIFLAAVLLPAAPAASARDCNPVSVAESILQQSARDEADALQRIAGLQARTVYPARFIQLLAPQAAAGEEVEPVRIQDRWKARFSNARDLAAGAPVRILASIPGHHRVYLFYAKQSDGEVRLVFPNIYEGPAFAAAQEDEEARPVETSWSRIFIPGRDAPYLLRLSATPDRYVLQAALVGKAFVTRFEEALRLWFDPREPFPLMRRHKGAFAGFLAEVAGNCAGSGFQMQRMFINTYPAD